MNRSTLFLVLLLLLTGAIIYFFLPSQKERETSDKGPDISFKVDSASVVKLEIQRTGKSVVIENVGGKWMITSPVHYQADPAAATRVISGLSKFKIGSLISSNPDKQHLFQVDSAGTQITATDRAGMTASLVIGKTGPAYSDVYFRLPASKDVYLGEGIDSWSINKEVKEWRDKTIYAQPAESIHDLSVTVRDKQYNFHRDSTTWKLGDKPVETNDINPLIHTLSSLHADDFVDTAFQFQSKPVTIAIQGVENATMELYPATADSSRYVVRSSSSPQLYVLSKYTVQQLLKPVDHGAGAKPAVAVSTPPPVKETPKKPVEEKTESVAKTSPPPETTKNVTPTEQTKTEEPVVQKKEPEQRPQGADNPPAKKPGRKTSPTGAIRTSKPPATTPGEQKTEPAAGSQTKSATSASEDEGELTVYTAKQGETMQSIAKKHGVTVEQILKWNLLKSIAVKPGQELYIYVRK